MKNAIFVVIALIATAAHAETQNVTSAQSPVQGAHCASTGNPIQDYQYNASGHLMQCGGDNTWHYAPEGGA